MAFYKMQDELLKAKQCALCIIERKALHQFFDGLLYERVTDPGIRTALARSGGFCPRHAHMLVGFGDALGTAILYQDQIRLRMEALRKVKPPARTRHARPLDSPGKGVCPACHYEEQTRMLNVHTLLQGLSDSGMAAAFTSSAGLCFPHFSLALNEAQEVATSNFLKQAQWQKVEHLQSQLKEFIDKHDHRRTAEEFAAEKDSWLRAVEFVSGMKNVF